MSEIAEKAQVALFMSDVVMAEATGKVNMLGGGVVAIGFDPQQGVTARFSVLAELRVPSELAPVEASVELALLDEFGRPAKIPGQAGPEAFRIAQIMQFEKPFAQSAIPMSLRAHVESSGRMVLDFGNGLPLKLGGRYTWQLRIDGDEAFTWTYPFVVPDGGPPPVFG